MTAAIYGMGTAQPPHFLPQELAANMVRSFLFPDEEGIEALEQALLRSGVLRRASVVLDDDQGAQRFYAPATSADDRGPTTGRRMERYAREAGPLAVQAARRALADSRCRPEEITHVVTVSCTGFTAPGIDTLLARCLELSPHVSRVHVGFMSCNGALNALIAAKALAESSASARVLLCAVELCTLHFQQGFEPAQLFADSLFGDGAAALVLGPEESGPAGAWRLQATGSLLMSDSAEAMTWQIGDHGFQMSLDGLAACLVSHEFRDWVRSWLAGLGLGLDQVGSWAIHPGGPRLASAVARMLKLPKGTTQVSAEVLAECGNMSSPTVLFVLERLYRTGAARPCVLMSFGPGVVVEAALLA